MPGERCHRPDGRLRRHAKQPEIKDVSRVLSRGFDGKPVDAVHNYGATPELARAKTEEWLVGDAMSFIHDTDVGEDDKLYGTDEGHDLIWILDRKTGKIEKYPLPDIDLPVGGMFSGFQLPIGIFTGKHGPHSSAQGRTALRTQCAVSMIMSSTRSPKLQDVSVGNDALYHTRFASTEDGIVWFTIVMSNQIGRFDPKTEQMTVMRLPSNGFWRWVSDLLFPTILKIASWFPARTSRWISHIRNSSVTTFWRSLRHRHQSEGWQRLVRQAVCQQDRRIDPKTMEVVESTPHEVRAVRASTATACCGFPLSTTVD
jgi:hypothetical protein